MPAESFNYLVYNEHCIPFGCLHPNNEIHEPIKLTETYRTLTEFLEKSLGPRMDLDKSIACENWISKSIKKFIESKKEIFSSSYKYSNFISFFKEQTGYDLKENYYQIHMDEILGVVATLEEDDTLPNHYSNLNLVTNLIHIINENALEIMNYYTNEYQIMFNRLDSNKKDSRENMVGATIESVDNVVNTNDGTFTSTLGELYEKVLYYTYFFAFTHMLYFTRYYTVMMFASKCYTYLERKNTIQFLNTKLPMYDHFFHAFIKNVGMRNSTNFFFGKVFDIDRHVFVNLEKLESYTFIMQDSTAYLLYFWYYDAYKALYNHIVATCPHITHTWLISKLAGLNFLISKKYIEQFSEKIPPAPLYVNSVDLPTMTKCMLWFQACAKNIARNLAADERMFVLITYKKFIDLEFLVDENIKNKTFQPQMTRDKYLDGFVTGVHSLLIACSHTSPTVEQMLKIVQILLTPGFGNYDIRNINPEHPTDIGKYLYDYWKKNNLTTLAYGRLQLFQNPTIVQ